MKDERCIFVKELLPLYIEKATDAEVTSLIGEHLKTCKDCNNAHKNIKTDLQSTPKTAESNKQTIRYINSIRLWYLLCPLLTLFFVNFGWSSVLRIYKGGLILFGACCIASEVFHRGTWWDPECIQLQDETRKNVCKKRGAFYIRPILIALPAILVVLVLEMPKLFNL